jgi:diaminopimelate decarboxylase
MFSGVGKTPREMDLRSKPASTASTSNPSPSSKSSISAPCKAGKKAPISFRINPDVDARTHAKISTGKKENKFGIAYERARAVYAHAAKLPGIEVTGIDMHIGSQITELQPFDDAFKLLRELVDAARRRPHIHHVDIGGGLGIPYKDDNNPPPLPDAYAGIVKNQLRELAARSSWSPAG